MHSPPLTGVAGASVAAAWNERHAIGCSVLYWPGVSDPTDNAAAIRSRTIGPAYLSAGEPVVEIEGLPFAVPLGRLRPRLGRWLRVCRPGSIGHWTFTTFDDEAELEQRVARVTDADAEAFVEVRSHLPEAV